MPRGYRMGLLLLGDSPSVPNGSTVTPINDVPTWLQCAGIPTTTYTTLAEVLADTSLLRILINSENAMDYLVRCKEWIKQEALVPVMTSNTTPSGECFGSSVESGHDYYYAFDGNSNTEWTSGNYNTDNYLGYGFTSPKNVKCCKFTVRQTLSTGGVIAGVLEKSSDKSNWTSIGSFETENLPNLTTRDITILCDDTDTYFRIRRTTGTDRFALRNVQLYSIEQGITDSQSAMRFIGANDYASNLLLSDSDWCKAICNSEYFEDILNVKVPTMTSATTPSGECFSSALHTNYSVVYAFDNNANTSMRFAQDEVNNYVGYKFDNDVSVNKCVIDYKGLNNTYLTRNFVLQASADNNTWTDIASDVLDISTPNMPLTKTFAINNTTDYAYLRLLFPDKMYIPGWTIELIQIQFYGRKDV
jgi:hypothetical protein